MATTTLDAMELDPSADATYGNGAVSQVRWGSDAGVDSMAMPGSGSESAFLIDFNGVLRTLTVTGTWTGTTAQISAQIQRIRALQDGMQSAVTFASTFIEDEANNAEIEVMIDRFDVTWSIPGLSAVWSMTLVEGTG